ncbi:Acetyl-coenzyme A synthetase [Roseibacterium elongatum DSM 19469]|uniref:Acetyl-coenzyme A synthetase n=1 Tax=Roseicyclus elongatus DSM 19469 TaxID=1294273 RepID=W8RVC1_9RHOB|nr:class I adenylate-forming enzyme family protein [Roseibacterium elongatum]AHM05233.1 Acetyl-coenzyme A synthetase [Roseibacterium elongatum DSM 19469]
MTDPCPAPFNLAHYVLGQADRLPDKVALAVLGPARAERWSYARLDRAVRGMAGGLLAHGFRPGDRLLLRLGNTPEFPVAFLGAIAAGLVPVPTAAVLTSGEITKLAEVIAPAGILAGDGVALPEGFSGPVLRDLAPLMTHAPADHVMGDPERLAYLVFTSGSGGTPKAVAHAHRAIWARRMMHQGWYGLREDDRLLHAGAFNWTFTLGTGLLDPWSVGATALIPAPGLEPAALPLLLKRHDATILAAAPGIFRKLLATDVPVRLPKLRHGLSAGEKLPEALRQRWMAATGTAVHEALGMSECSTFISGSPARPAPQGTLGHAQAGRRVAVLNETGQAVAEGDTGILAIHRDDPGLMLGYQQPDGSLDLPLTGDWFLTGDMVEQRGDGAFTYHGRRDDLITAGGFRVSPLEIEAAFQHAPGVQECAALALSPKADTTIVALAFVGDATEDRLRDLAAASLARYKQPRTFIRLPALPRNPNGKLDRRALRARVEEAS